MTYTGAPSRSLDDFDHHDPTLTDQKVRTTWNAIREQCPVFHSDKSGGFDMITRYDDVSAALRDSGTFSSADGVGTPPRGGPRVPALEFDDPEHKRWRNIMAGTLTARAVREFEPVIVETVDSLLDHIVADGHADLVSDVAVPLPALVIARMLGLDPEPALELQVVADELFASIGTDAFADKKGTFDAHTRVHLADRRAHPRDDLLTQMAGGNIDGEPIDEEGIDGLMVAYFIGGHHSTSSAIGGLFAHVLSDEAAREAVSLDDTVLRSAVEESLRLTTPLQHFGRTTRCPVEISDVRIPEGGRVMLNLAAANRDPRMFENPDEFDLERASNRHVAFGGGIHLCAGQHLARAEMRIALVRLLERVPDVTLSGSVTRSGLIGGSLSTTLSMPVTFTPQTCA